MHRHRLHPPNLEPKLPSSSHIFSCKSCRHESNTLREYKLHLFQHFANNNDGGNGTFMSKTALKMHFHRKHKSFKPAESTQNVAEPHNSVEPARVIQIRGTESYFDLQNDTPANLTDFFLVTS
jgi:hypothetical protein